MKEKKTLILIDGHALAFRQYYALERTGMKNSENLPTWAVYGFFKAIFDLLSKIKPDFIAVAFDVGRQTFRVEKFEEYKANREAMPDTLRCQISTIVEGLNAFDIPIYTKEGRAANAARPWLFCYTAVRSLFSLSALQKRIKPMMNRMIKEPTARFSFCSCRPNTLTSMPAVIWLTKATSIMPAKEAPLPQISIRP